MLCVVVAEAHGGAALRGDALQVAALALALEEQRGARGRHANLRTAGALLAEVPPSAMAPGEHAAVRLYVDDNLTAEQRAALCAEVPARDYMAGMLDEEAQASCGGAVR